MTINKRLVNANISWRTFCQKSFSWSTFVETVFVYSITSAHITTESSIILHIYHFCNFMFQDSKCIFVAHTMFFLHSHWHLLLLHFWLELHFLLSNLHSHLHGICFANVLDLFIPVIMLKLCKFKPSASIGTNTLLNKSSRVLQLSVFQSGLIANR